jgi:hypothetical protein
MLGIGVDRPVQSFQVVGWRGQVGPFRRPVWPNRYLLGVPA